MAIESKTRIAPAELSPPDLARLAVETFVLSGETISPPRNPKGLMAERAGAFVSLRDSSGALRGCIGTIEPTCGSVAGEIIKNAISAATRDPRFAELSRQELPGLRYGVDVLSEPENVAGIEHLAPLEFGVIIEDASRNQRGVLLPRIPGIKTAEEQWNAVHAKAGISIGSAVHVQRFTVRRFGKD
jgi:AmmeMemoRadiSam system protein A